MLIHLRPPAQDVGDGHGHPEDELLLESDNEFHPEEAVEEQDGNSSGSSGERDPAPPASQDTKEGSSDDSSSDKGSPGKSSSKGAGGDDDDDRESDAKSNAGHRKDADNEEGEEEDPESDEDNLGVTASQTTEPFPGDDERTPVNLSSRSSSSEAEEDEDQRDSQVSSGWLGKAINYYSRREERESEKAQKLLDDLLKDLQPELIWKDAYPAYPKQVTEWLKDPETLKAYMAHCKDSLMNFGDAVYGILSSRTRYVEWVTEWKCKAGT